MTIRVDCRLVSRWLLLIVPVFFFAAGRSQAQASCTGVANDPRGGVTWVPQWCEEFNATAAGTPDTAVWSFDLGNSGFGNNEIETYCGPPGYSQNPSNCPSTFSTATSNAYLDGSGHLVIKAINTPNTANLVLPPFFSPKTRVWLPIAMVGFIVSVVVAPVAPRRRRTWLYVCALVAGLTFTGATTWSCGGGGSSTQITPPPNNNGSTWFSARMKTQGLQDFMYGRIEASIQLPDTTNPGLWPAFWSLGSDIATTPWPACGEVDFMEDWSPKVLNGPGPAGNKTTIHTTKTGGNGIGGLFTFPTGQQADTSFHTYGTIWSANMMQFYVDDPTKPFLIETPSDLPSGDTWPFNAKAFLITNIAVGGTLGGTTSASTPNPGVMMVDYARQYQASAAAPPPIMGTPPPITVQAGTTTGTSTLFPALASATGYTYFSCSTNAPNASCVISTSDLLNKFVVSSSAAESVTATVTTNGTPPGSTYSVTVYAFTETNTSDGSNSNADANVAIPLTVN